MPRVGDWPVNKGNNWEEEEGRRKKEGRRKEGGRKEEGRKKERRRRKEEKEGCVGRLSTMTTMMVAKVLKVHLLSSQTTPKGRQEGSAS